MRYLGQQPAASGNGIGRPQDLRIGLQRRRGRSLDQRLALSPELLSNRQFTWSRRRGGLSRRAARQRRLDRVTRLPSLGVADHRVGRNLLQQAGVCQRNRRVRHRQHRYIPAMMRQVLREFRHSLNPGASHRRKLIGDQAELGGDVRATRLSAIMMGFLSLGSLKGKRRATRFSPAIALVSGRIYGRTGSESGRSYRPRAKPETSESRQRQPLSILRLVLREQNRPDKNRSPPSRATL
jgi:hypothetical protein